MVNRFFSVLSAYFWLLLLRFFTFMFSWNKYKLFKPYLRTIMGSQSTDDCGWKGSPMHDIYRGTSQFELPQLPPIVNKRDHIVLFHLPFDSNASLPPKPHIGTPKWDQNHVRLPSAPQNEYFIVDENNPNEKIAKKRWEIIQTALLQPISSSRELEKAILSYNTKYAKQWKFHALHRLFEEELEESEAAAFFENTLPEIVRLALQLPDIVPNAIPLLKHGTSKSISLSQQQVACLLANAFLCTFPRRNATYNRKSEYRNFPSINFNNLYCQKPNSGDQVLEKIKCICNYFLTVCKKMPTGVITFSRRMRSANCFPDWSKCDACFNESTLVHISSDGTIEDEGCGLLQVDFANKYIGGGVLNTGCVQEEIRFVICPELLCSLLFTERMDLNECLIIMGCERFNSYTGYASSFKWNGTYVDHTPMDAYRRKMCSIVAIDATYFHEQSHQYEEELIKRELNKAFVGFYHELNTPAPAVATGNWGCGAFNGDKSLKSLLQLMVCCVTNRPLVYFTFGDKQLRDDFYTIYQYLTRNKVKIAELWSYLKQFRKHKLPAEHLYPFIVQSHRDASQYQTTKQATENIKINSSTINSPTEQRSSSPNIEDDSDDQMAILDQIDAAEKSYLEKQTLKSADKSPGPLASYERPKSPATNETKEKRQRSLLDCLDQSYFQEMPPKIKRDLNSSSSSSIGRNPHDANASENVKASGSCDLLSQYSTDTIVDSESETNISLMNQMDKLESLHVVSETNSAEGAVESSPEYIPPTLQQ